MSGLSAPPGLSTSMRTLIVRVFVVDVGAMFATVPRQVRPGRYESVIVAGMPEPELRRSDS